ncbi:SDR family NAD(P)-dependent oxidoreductase [Modicisalibacter luteus]|uniref:SDR family NAD(P)-dependent oxidoreductase n=1 Tax=Modicisalibacter luteus TaxID=453962 RepID=UPI003641990F
MSASPILITGGAQRLGRHCAERLVDDGHDVIITYRRERAELDVLRQRGIVTLRADFSSEAGILDFIDHLKSQIRSLRAIVHNASDWAPDSSGEDAGINFERLFRVHMQAPT